MWLGEQGGVTEQFKTGSYQRVFLSYSHIQVRADNSFGQRRPAQTTVMYTQPRQAQAPHRCVQVHPLVLAQCGSYPRRIAQKVALCEVACDYLDQTLHVYLKLSMQCS